MDADSAFAADLERRRSRLVESRERGGGRLYGAWARHLRHDHGERSGSAWRCGVGPTLSPYFVRRPLERDGVRPVADRALVQPSCPRRARSQNTILRRSGTIRRCLRAVYEEWRSQIARLRSLGLSVSHLDSHHNLHSRFALLQALRRIVTETGIRRVRNIHDIVSPRNPLSWRGQMKRRAWSWRDLLMSGQAVPRICAI